MRQPKQKFNVTSTKIPKTTVEIGQYKNQNISWQTNRIDSGSQWGFAPLQCLKLNIPEEKINELGESRNELFDAMMDLNQKIYSTTDDFLHRLDIESKKTVTAIEQKELLKHIDNYIFWNEIYPKLKEFERKNWFEIERETFGKRSKSKHHYVKVADLIPEAQKRLVQLNLDDYDELYSLRLSGKIRVWGIREFGYLKVLWFDLEHEICPSLKE
jgi:hypothetical protein